jgi:hypothetical protein
MPRVVHAHPAERDFYQSGWTSHPPEFASRITERMRAFNEIVKVELTRAETRQGRETLYKVIILDGPKSRIAVLGRDMEETTQLLQDANNELAESKKILQDLVNECKALTDTVRPHLAKQISEVRTSRMTIVREVQQSLSALKDVRKFFLDSDYGEEMARLENFVGVCEQLRALKDDGTLDAVGDLAIRLALKEPQNGG